MNYGCPLTDTHVCHTNCNSIPHFSSYIIPPYSTMITTTLLLMAIAASLFEEEPIPVGQQESIPRGPDELVISTPLGNSNFQSHICSTGHITYALGVWMAPSFDYFYVIIRCYFSKLSLIFCIAAIASLTKLSTMYVHVLH